MNPSLKLNLASGGSECNAKNVITDHTNASETIKHVAPPRSEEHAMTTTLRLTCTVCGRKLRAISASNVAADVRRQKCRGCNAPQTIKIVPKEIDGGVIHLVAFAATRSPR